MLTRKLFPGAIGACLALTMMSVATRAQTVETRQRLVADCEQSNDHAILEDEPIIISLASPGETSAASAEPVNNFAANYERMIYAAIDQRLGARYVWGATGPFGFDCSGFVWSTFKSAGVDFERGSARTLWSRLAPAAPDEHFKFGTLVFFSGLKHIGIVADETWLLSCFADSGSCLLAL